MILECKQCEALVNAELVADYTVEDENNPPNTYSFLKCPKCSGPFLTNDYMGWGPDCLYPLPVTRINPNLPAPLKAAYEEATSCFKSKAYTATAIMCRKTLEGICAEHGTTGRTLVASLKELKDKGIIENRLYEWADALRISGNEAAHDVNITTSAQDAKDIIEFTNALLEYVFTFRDKFEAFKNRRAAKDRA